MNARIDGPYLVRTFVLRRRAHVGVFMLLGSLLAGSVVALATVRDSAEDAILDSVRADLGHRSYAFQTGHPEAIRAVTDVPDASPVEDETGDVASGDLSTAVLVRQTTDASLHMGVLVLGSWPDQPGEAVISQDVAASLNISLGQPVEIRAGGIRTSPQVVGFLVDPADRSDRTVALLLPPEVEHFQPTRWLRDSDFYEVAELQPFLDRRTATYSSLDSLLADVANNQPRFLSAMRFLPVGVGILFGILVCAVTATFWRRWSHDVEALVAAGMPAALGWRRVLTAVVGALVVGELAGAAAVVGLIYLARNPVSAWLGQDWVSVVVPWQEPLVLMVVTIMAATLTLPTVRLTRWTSRFVSHPALRKRVATPVALGMSLIAVGVWVVSVRAALRPDGDTAALWAALAAVVVAMAVPFLLTPALGMGLPPASRSIVNHLNAGMRPVAAVAAAVVLVSGLWSAETTGAANRGEAMSSPLEPAGSYVISAMPDSAVGTLKQFYSELGGSEVVTYQIPDETSKNLRVTGPRLVECMSQNQAATLAEVPPTCLPAEADSPVNIVMIGEPGTLPVADPGLLQDGEVGLLLFTGSHGRVTRMAITDAAPAVRLGGNLPGLVVAPDSDVARSFDLIPSGASEVVLLDFSSLTPHEQFMVRATVRRLAPGAQTVDGTDPTAYDRLRSIANTVSFTGAAGAAILTLLGGLAMVVAHVLVRRTLLDLGAAPGPRRSIILRGAALPALGAASATGITYLTVTLGLQHTEVARGFLWCLPGLVVVLATAGIAVAFLRVPPPAAE